MYDVRFVFNLMLFLVEMLLVQSLLSDVMTEEVLVLHEKELTRTREYYEQNKVLLEKVAKRQQMWNEFLELEV